MVSLRKPRVTPSSTATAPAVEKSSTDAAAQEAAAQAAIRQRMDENAATAGALDHKDEPPLPEPQQPSAEQIIAGSPLPDRAKDWLRQHPEYVTDPIKNAQLQKLHNVAEYQAGGEWTDGYFDRINVLLGFKQEQLQQPNSNRAQPTAQTVVRRQYAAGPSVSAPPTREAPSMTTGRAFGHMQQQLNKDEREIAWASRPHDNMTRQEAEAQYLANKRKMLAMKAAGELQGDRG
jgi:hypothetical protein